jgi:hypothetical protein
MRGLFKVTTGASRVTLGQTYPSAGEGRAGEERLAFEQRGDARKLVCCRACQIEVAGRDLSLNLRLE